MSRDSNLCGCCFPVVDNESARVFTSGFDEQEQAITIMKGEVFFTGFGFKDFIVSEGACDTRHVWIHSKIGTHLMDHSVVST